MPVISSFTHFHQDCQKTTAAAVSQNEDIRSALINTPLQWGVNEMSSNRFHLEMDRHRRQ